MRASVDVSNMVVRCDDSTLPFHLDLEKGTASIELDGRPYEVRPLTWRAKLRLARFAPLSESFVQARFLEASTGKPEDNFGGERSEAVLLALAIWINRPSDDRHGLPLDQRKLAALTVDLCRSLGVGPMAFAELTAPEVEMLWQNADHSAIENEIEIASIGVHPPRAIGPEQVAQKFDTRIVIVPDETAQNDVLPESVSEPEPDAEPHTEPERLVRAVSDLDTGQVNQEEKRDASLTSNRAAPVRQNRFRVSLSNPVAKAPQKASAVLRMPISRPRHFSSQRVNPENFAAPVLTKAEHAASAEQPFDLEISPNFEKPAPSFSPVQPEVTPDTSRWPTAGETSDPVSSTNAEDVELMLDVFCDRLAEAAADLGIMEEV